MKVISIANRTRNVFFTSLSCVGVLASLPILVVLFLALRPVLLVAAVVAVIASLSWCLFGSLRTALLRVQTNVSNHKNRLRLPSDVMLHPKHAWVRIERGDELVVGIDDLAQSVLGPVQEVESPAVGRHVKCNEPLVHLRCGIRRLCLCAPVSGTVLGCNEHVLRRPQLVNDEPYDAGWIVRLCSDDVREDCQRLLGGPSAGIWFDEEVKRVAGRLAPSVATATPSGEKPPIRQLYLGIDDAAWRKFTETITPTGWWSAKSPTDDPDGNSKDDRRDSA
jgi:glycine cleavage system H protein